MLALPKSSFVAIGLLEALGVAAGMSAGGSLLGKDDVHHTDDWSDYIFSNASRTCNTYIVPDFLGLATSLFYLDSEEGILIESNTWLFTGSCWSCHSCDKWNN
ncbi:hypothetical protein QJS10_CPA05g01472 [Acorus calamus]|uniref:Uncharacterized protein n=1 Tax=Acorus calamus TaxID=4465 RepID=A0AAV9EXB0_ACOCL|nr:hypothetical protein QJS10_CPA05g01472 [Acorus calamus]